MTTSLTGSSREEADVTTPSQEGSPEMEAVGIEAALALCDGWEKDGPDDEALHIFIRRVRAALAAVVDPAPPSPAETAEEKS